MCCMTTWINISSETCKHATWTSTIPVEVQGISLVSMHGHQAGRLQPPGPNPGAFVMQAAPTRHILMSAWVQFSNPTSLATGTRANWCTLASS